MQMHCHSLISDELISDRHSLKTDPTRPKVLVRLLVGSGTAYNADHETCKLANAWNPFNCNLNYQVYQPTWHVELTLHASFRLL